MALVKLVGMAFTSSTILLVAISAVVRPVDLGSTNTAIPLVSDMYAA